MRAMASGTVLAVVMSVSSVCGADWPQYRCDGVRSGYTAEPLPAKLALAWVRQARHEPHRAWVGRQFALSRMHFDWTYSTVAAGGNVYFGSSADHKVYALDVVTGQEKWSFFTGGPVRLAPAIWRDRLVTGSDDGCVHCLDRNTGTEIWRLRVGPSGEQLIGNSRMISRWAVRGGIAVRDGVAYIGAGNWPEENVYILAVDIASGKTLWQNDNTGALEIDQPHMVCFSRGGVIAQGYLAVTDAHVLVATGRSTPAVFDRSTGDFLYYHLSRYGGKTPWGIGGGDIVATDNWFFNSGLFFDADTGLRYSDRAITQRWWTPYQAADGRRVHGEYFWGGRQGVVATPTEVVRYDGRKLCVSAIARTSFVAVRDVPTAYGTLRLEFRGMRDGKHKKEDVRDAPSPKDRWSLVLPGEPVALIVAGGQAVVGLGEQVCLVDLAGRRVTWTARTDAPARSLAVANGRLLVSTDKGTIYCFTEDGEGSQGRISPRPPVLAANDSGMREAVGEALAKSGVDKGYCLVPDGAGAALVLELVRQSALYVVALEQDSGRARGLRTDLDLAGVYGPRCVVLSDVAVSDLPDYFVNLIVARAPAALRGENPELDRVLRPYGGVMCELDGETASVVTRRDGLPGAGEWTHNFGNAGNTLYSGDTVVRGPLGMLWYEDETQRTIDRHGKNPAPLAYKGLLLREGLDSLRCRDAYNGTVLYDIELPGVLAAYVEGTQVGAAHIGNTYCVADDVLYVRLADECRTYNVFSGEPLGVFRAPAMPDGSRGKWGHVACRDGVLIGSLMNESYVIKANHGQGDERMQKPMDDHLTESKLVFAFDAASGTRLWKRQPKQSIRNNTLALGGGIIYMIDREPAAIDKLLRTEVAARLKAGKPVPEHRPGTLLALDARTGQVRWQSEDDVFGTFLAVDPAQDVLLMSYYHVGFPRPSETKSRIRVYRASIGTQLWQGNWTGSRPAIGPGVVYSFPMAFDLTTGKTKTVSTPVADAAAGDVWKIEGKGQGCGTVAASQNLLLIRSATLGYYDLTFDRKWIENYGGMRPGCFINYLPALGVVLVPEDTLACRCSYQNQATIALKEYGLRPPVVEPVPGQNNFAYFPRSKEPFFTGTLEVRMWHPRDDLQIRYTLDNTYPTATSSVYTEPLELSETTTVRAALFRGDRKVETKDAVIFRKTDDWKPILKQGMKR